MTPELSAGANVRSRWLPWSPPSDSVPDGVELNGVLFNGPASNARLPGPATRSAGDSPAGAIDGTGAASNVRPFTLSCSGAAAVKNALPPVDWLSDAVGAVNMDSGAASKPTAKTIERECMINPLLANQCYWDGEVARAEMPFE